MNFPWSRTPADAEVVNDGMTEPTREDDSDETRDLHALALERFRTAHEADEEDRGEAAEDNRFLNGQQWPDSYRTEREGQGLPCLTSNRLPQFVKQVIGDQRMNRPTVDVKPEGDRGDAETANVLKGMIRSIMRRSAPSSEAAIDNAAECSTGFGRGFFRVNNRYCDDESFDQELIVRAIHDAFSVVWDPAAKEVDLSDADYMFVHEVMSREEFKRQYPDRTEESFDTSDPTRWVDGQNVRVAEYWYRQRETAKLYRLPDGTITDVLPEDAEPVDTREVRRDKIRWCVISGHEVLEGPYDWPGRFIPIIPVWGEIAYVDGKRRTKGLIRFAKDDQRLHNYAKSVKAEMLVMAPKTPWIVTKKMVDGLEHIWNMVHQRKLPFITYNPDPQAPQAKPERIQPIMVQQGVEAEVAESAEAMKANTGIYDASLGNRSNETSGKAILARQKEGDTATYIFVDNLARAITHLGNVLIDLIPRVYSGPRMVQILNDDDTDDFVTVNQPVELNALTGEPIGEQDIVADPSLETIERVMYDLSKGKYQVAVTTGPSFSTRRIEAAESMMELSRAVPTMLPLVADIMIGNMDWPDADRISKRLSVMVPPEARAAEEGREMIPQMPAGMPAEGGM